MALRVLAYNVADLATLSASPSLAASLPEAHLQTRLRAQVARTTSTASQTISATWSSAQALSMVALAGHNLSADAEWQIEAFTNGDFTGSAYDSGTLSGAHPAHYFEPVLARSLRIMLDNAANPAGYLQAARLVAGAYWQPETEPDYGGSARWIDPADLSRTEGYSLLSNCAGTPYRALDLSLSFLTADDRAALLEVLRRAGAGGEVWASLCAGDGGTLEADHAVCGIIPVSDGLKSFVYLRHGGRITLEDAYG